MTAKGILSVYMEADSTSKGEATGLAAHLHVVILIAKDLGRPTGWIMTKF